MPTAAGRRVGCSVLAGLVAGVILLPLLPGDPGSIRIAGVRAFWWLAIAVARARPRLAGGWGPRVGEPRPDPAGALVLAGAAGFVLPVVVVAAAVGAAPWSAWSRAASQPAFKFGERSVWVTDGRGFVRL